MCACRRDEVRSYNPIAAASEGMEGALLLRGTDGAGADRAKLGQRIGHGATSTNTIGGQYGAGATLAHQAMDGHGAARAHMLINERQRMVELFWCGRRKVIHWDVQARQAVPRQRALRQRRLGQREHRTDAALMKPIQIVVEQLGVMCDPIARRTIATARYARA